ncbi:MAG: hypothetical protein F4Z60_08045 [Chloroflexi bacterium]|nr:hypothetical protein [Chloroflexota bacterium]
MTEVRARRDKFAVRCGYDVEKEIFRRIRQRQAKSGVERVNHLPGRVAHRQHATGPLSDDDAKRDDHGA